MARPESAFIYFKCRYDGLCNGTEYQSSYSIRICYTVYEFDKSCAECVLPV